MVEASRLQLSSPPMVPPHSGGTWIAAQAAMTGQRRGVRGAGSASGEQVAEGRLGGGEAEGEAVVQQALRHLALSVEEERG